MAWRKGNRLPVVTEAQAEGRTREIYSEIRAAFGLQYVDTLFQVFGGIPIFLDLQWKMLKPAVMSERFFELGERLRADAYTRMHNYFEIPDLCAQIDNMQFSEGAREELTELVDLHLYKNPLLLLMVAAQMQAFEGAVGETNAARKQASHPEFTSRPALVDEDSASPELKKIFEEMKKAFGTPVVHTDYRALARFPDFLRSYWTVLKPMTESPLYQQCLHSIRESAWTLTRELPGPLELSVGALEDAGMTEGDIASAVRLTELFSHGLGAVVLNDCMAKIGLEGGNLAHKSRQKKHAGQEANSEAVPASKEPTRAA